MLCSVRIKKKKKKDLGDGEGGKWDGRDLKVSPPGYPTATSDVMHYSITIAGSGCGVLLKGENIIILGNSEVNAVFKCEKKLFLAS